MPPLVLLAPCLLGSLYLCASLLIFKFGPIEWPVENEKTFWLFNALYLPMFILGGVCALMFRKFLKNPREWYYSAESISKFFWPILGCAGVVVLIGHRNISLGASYFPYSIFSDFVFGLVNPLDAYLYKFSDQAVENFSGNPLLTALSGVFAFSKLMLLCLLVSQWTNLSTLKKIVGMSVILFPILSGVSVGTNKPIFDVAFALIAITSIYMFLAPASTIRQFIASRWVLIFVTGLVFLFSVGYFKHTMSVRAPGLNYAESLSSSAGVVRVNPRFNAYCDASGEFVRASCHLFVTGSIYLTQGYYGMSLSTSLPLESTYGVGHSSFMTDALRKYFGVDLSPRTFQHRINDRWSASAQWHSAYSQWANDVGFFGVTAVMFMIGFYVSVIWASALYTGNLFAICSTPLLLTLIIFIPANNQIFNIFESLMTFMVLLLAWLASVLPVRRVLLSASTVFSR